MRVACKVMVNKQVSKEVDGTNRDVITWLVVMRVVLMDATMAEQMAELMAPQMVE